VSVTNEIAGTLPGASSPYIPPLSIIVTAKSAIRPAT